MNYIQEAFKRLNELGSAKKEAFTPYANGVGGWKELPTFEDVVEFGKGSKWIVSRPDAERYYNRYLKKYPGAVFVGREDPKAGKMLGMKQPSGKIIFVYDANNHEVKSFDMEPGSAKDEAFTPYANGVGGWKELPTFEDVVKFGKGSKWVVARPDGERHYDYYLKKHPGAVFVGRTDPKVGRMLGMKLENGEIIDVYDEKDYPVKSFDMNLGETCKKGDKECKEGDEACKEDMEEEDKECFFEIVYKVKDDEEEKTERYDDDFDGARADYLHMTQDEGDDYEYVVLRKVCTNYEDEEEIEILDSFGLDESLKEKCKSCDEGFKDPIKYEGFTITATDDGKWLVDEWYEYYDSKGAAMEAIDKYIKELHAKAHGEPKKD